MATYVVQFGLDHFLGFAHLVKTQKFEKVFLHPGFVGGVVVTKILDHHFPFFDG